MAFRTNKYAVAIAVQSDAVTPATVTNADILPCYGLQPGGDIFRIQNPEATGTRNAKSEQEIGRGRSVTFNCILRGPGGVAPPAAGTWVMGRLLRAVGFKEEVQAAPLIASTALGGVGTTSTAILNAGASGVDDFYNGLPIILPSGGVGMKAVSMIRDYVGASKTATLMETYAAAPAGNFTIPAFLAYRYWDAAPDMYLSVDYWLDKKRYKLVNGTITQFERSFQVSNNGDTAYTTLTVTITGDVHPTTAELDENSPTVPDAGNGAIFRDADFWVAGKSVCGSGATSQFQIESARPPCPSTLSGGEAPEITSIRRQWALNLNEVLLSQQDYNALAADHQTNDTSTGVWLQYGGSSGKTVSAGIMDAQLGYSEASEAGQFWGRSLNAYINKIEKSESFVFPYW